jgi:creatinine amidohydrolase/Fe(II)-dependent formamide hydrolase-like protein
MLPRLAVAANASGKTLKQHAADFLKMHENLPHRSDDSLAVYTAVTNSFLASTTAIYPNDINQDDVIRWLG